LWPGWAMHSGLNGNGTENMRTKLYDKEKHQIIRKPEKKGSAKWLTAGLLCLGVLPPVLGVFRITALAGGAAIMPADARFSASPLPVVLHIVSARMYTLLGAFQFSSGFRRRRPGWHRMAGRLLVICGLLVGLSALWMTVFYPLKAGTGELLYA